MFIWTEVCKGDRRNTITEIEINLILDIAQEKIH